MADAKRVPIPGLRFTGGGVPVPPADALADSMGAFLYLDLTHPVSPVAGVPAAVPNLVSRNAARMLGAPDTGITLSNTFGAGGAVERTSKGGLHIVPSRTADVTGNVFQALMTPAMASFVHANQGDQWFLSMSLRVTRAGAAGIPVHLARFAQNTSTYIAAISEGSSGTSVFGEPSANRTSAASPGLMHISVAASGSGLTSIGQWFVSGGPIAAGMLHKTPSFVLYNFYAENLTRSGKSYAAVRTLAENMHSTQHASGRWAGDTWTPPATLVA